ncbi:MAG: gluconokinase [Janthinobacterium lividum]
MTDGRDDAAGVPPQVLVVMGVSGSGKTSVAKALDERLHWPFQEGDDLHPPANVEKMRSGHALTDEDRAPWLRAVAAWIEARRQAGEPGVITCSALRRAYRDAVTGGHPGVRVVYLKADRALIEERLGQRQHHYMPAALLESQLATLEEPSPDEHVLTVAVHGSVEDIAAEVAARLRAGA